VTGDLLWLAGNLTLVAEAASVMLMALTLRESKLALWQDFASAAALRLAMLGALAVLYANGHRALDL
jgi:hypothetical protein